MTKPHGRLLCVILAGVVAASVAAPAAAAAEPPANIVAIGDSITRATNVCCWYGDHPSYSWSTGFNPLDGLNSHYERLIGQDASIWGDEYNDARAGARMADAPAQASIAVSQGAEYVTILMGANDVCTSDVTTMTPIDSFRASFESTMTTLASGLSSNAKILVASIPNVRRVWTLFHDNATARYIWRTYHVCQSMLSTSSTLEDRRAVYQHTLALNQVLESVCTGYANCRFDGYAVFNHLFSKDDVSKLDYFHPSRTGQNVLATLTWSASWWA
jgi:lysophospholipase L1-like esterase